MSRPHGAAEDVPPPLPEPWWASAHRLADDPHPISTSPLTSLITFGPHGEVVVAEAMELASWSEIGSGDVQVRLCREPECGIEHCLVGSWVRVSTDEHGVLLGPTEESTARSPTDRREYAPPRWMLEHGPCLIASERWDLIVRELAERTALTGRYAVRIPSFADLRASGRPPAAGLGVS